MHVIMIALMTDPPRARKLPALSQLFSFYNEAGENGRSNPSSREQIRTAPGSIPGLHGVAHNQVCVRGGERLLTRLPLLQLPHLEDLSEGK